MGLLRYCAVIALAMLAMTLFPSKAASAADNEDGKPTISQINGPVTTEAPVIVVGVPLPNSVDQINDRLFGYNTGAVFTTYSNSLNSFHGDGRVFSLNNKTASAIKKNNKAGCKGYASDPVEIDDGAKLLTIPLFALPGEMGLKYTLYYHSVTSSSFWAYNPWASSISYALDLYCGYTNPNIPCNQVTLYRPDGSSVSFSGNHASFGNFPEIGGGGLATLTHNSDGTWTAHDEDATVQTYDQYGYFQSIKDASGVGWTVTSSTVETPGGPPVQPCAVPVGVHPLCVPDPPPPTPPTDTTTTIVTHTNGQSFKIVEVVKNPGQSNVSGSVTVTDPAGNQYSYSLSWYWIPGGSGLLGVDVASLIFPGSPTTTMTFSYTGANQLLSGIAYNGTAYWKTGYDGNNRVNSDGAADGTQTTSILYAYPSGGMVATITNPLGHTTTNTYTADSQGFYLLTSLSNSAVIDCGSTVSSSLYDSNDNLKQTVDNNQITHLYTYASNGQLQTETQASGTSVARTINYKWDPNQQLNRLTRVTAVGESQIDYGYNAQNRLASITRTNLSSNGTPNQALTTSYTYTLYGNGMVQSMTVTAPSPSGTAKVTTNYDALGNVTTVVDGLGHTTTYSNYTALGEPQKIVGPNGDETDYTYDARGRVSTKTTHPNGTTAKWTYTYDGFGLLYQISAPDGEVTTWNRDAEMRVKTITHNDKDGTSTETFGYDNNNDVTSDVISRGSDVGKSTTILYDALGRVYQRKGNHGQVLTYAYDGNGNVLSVTDALGHKTSYTYDALNRVSTMTDAKSGVTQYFYDAGDHLTKVIDPRGLTTTYAWDGLGLLWKQVSPDTGTTSFSYDTYGRLYTKTRADGVQAVYTYDGLNRLTKITAGGQSQTWTYDTCINGKGRLCSASDSTETTSYSYTPEGWIAGRGFAFSSGPTYSIGYSYNSMGQLAVAVYPDGNQALYDYADGAVADVRFKEGSSTFYGISAVSYRPMDLAMSKWTSFNGLASTLTFDSDLRLSSIVAPGIQNLSFSYDNADRINKITNGMDGTLTQTLGYDELDRLKTVSSTADNESYNYDADGNRTSQVINGTSTTYTVSPTSNQLSSVSGGMDVTYGYDPQGDTTTLNGATAYQYNSFGRLINADGTGYEVSAEGQRLRKIGAGVSTYFAPDVSGALLAEQRNGMWIDYVWLNGRLMTILTPSGGIYPVHTDQTGRPMVLSTTVGQSVEWQAQNLPFDRKVTDTTWFDQNVGFPGQYRDAEDGLYYNGNRDYDPLSGRYIESDPTGLKGGINTYVYAGANPISTIDPPGLSPDDVYSSVREAGYAAISQYNGLSIQTNREYAGVIYANWLGGYSYTSPNVGTNDASDNGYAPIFHTEVGLYHTHAAYDPNYDNEDFSPTDLDTADNANDGNGVPSFLGTPSGAILMYDPSTGRVYILRKGNCP